MAVALRVVPPETVADLWRAFAPGVSPGSRKGGTMMRSIADLYNRAAPDWERQTPLLVSDFTARPFVLALCEPLAEAAVLDVGCGEGYMTRQLRQCGATTVVGIDISAGMLAAAQTAEQAHPLGITYRTHSE